MFYASIQAAMRINMYSTVYVYEGAAAPFAAIAFAIRRFPRVAIAPVAWPGPAPLARYATPFAHRWLSAKAMIADRHVNRRYLCQRLVGGHLWPVVLAQPIDRRRPRMTAGHSGAPFAFSTTVG